MIEKTNVWQGKAGENVCGLGVEMDDINQQGCAEKQLEVLG